MARTDGAARRRRRTAAQYPGTIPRHDTLAAERVGPPQPATTTFIDAARISAAWRG